jgi:rubrerythrin
MNENDFNKLIDFAIDQENQAFAFYTSAAEKVSNPGVKKIFKELAQDENGHANLLEMWRNNKALAAVFKIEALDYKIAETQDMPELSLALSQAEAIAIAMKKEQMAAELYKSLAANAVGENEREALENLSRMEMGHKHKLENIFVEIGYPEVF